MASLQCSNCKYGIHYHDEANGTEWTAFELDTWEKLISSPLELASYRGSTQSGWYYVWRCKKCGALHFFKSRDSMVYKAFAPSSSSETFSKIGIKGIAFSDLVWDDITESDETGNSFEGVYKDVSRQYFILSDNFLLVYSDKNFEHLKQEYISIEIPQ